MFELATPWLLLLLLLPFAVQWLLPRADSILPSALKIPFFAILQEMTKRTPSSLFTRSQKTLLFLIWSLLVFAATGPLWVGDPLPIEREGRNIMLVLDLSGSMELNDMFINGQPISRLAIVKEAAKQFVNKRAGDRIGLILFGSQAYLQTPLTYDLHSVQERLDDATVGLAGKNTAIGDGLGLAIKRLQEVPPKSRVIILLTDGANNAGVIEPVKAAELAKLEQIKVYTIGLGSETNAQLANNPFYSMAASAALDEKTLKKIATITGGHYFRATDLQSLQSIYQKIDQLEAIKQEQATFRPRHEYYPWPLALALCLFLIWFTQTTSLFNQVIGTLKRRTRHHG